MFLFKNLKLHLFISVIVYVLLCVCMLCVCTHACTCHAVHMEVRRQAAGVNSLIPPYGSWGLNSSGQDWQQAPL